MRHVGERARAKGKTGLKVRYVSDRTDCRFFLFILKESAKKKKKNAPRGPHRPGDGGTGRTGTE